MATSIMKLPLLKPGYWWWNTAPVGQDPVWEQKPMPDPVVLDCQIKTLFGYETREFMARQYRSK